LRTNGLWLGEGIFFVSYILVIIYSLGEVKGNREKKREAVPKWEERWGFLATSVWEWNRSERRAWTPKVMSLCPVSIGTQDFVLG
jgi:hypothetical protein